MKQWYVTAYSYEDGGFTYEIPDAEFCTKQQALASALKKEVIT